MKSIATSLPGVLIIESPVFRDERGFFMETFHSAKFEAIGLQPKFVQDNHSRSEFGVIRGLHYQVREPQGKLVRAVTGSVFDVAVDIRRSSPTFGQWIGVTLTSGDGRQLWIPPGFAHGFAVLSEVADINYKCTTLYDASADRCIRWNDQQLNIAWPPAIAAAAKLSDRDSRAPAFSDAELFA